MAVYWILGRMTLLRADLGPAWLNEPPCGSTQKCYGFFLAPCYTLPPNLTSIMLVVFGTILLKAGKQKQTTWKI